MDWIKTLPRSKRLALLTLDLSRPLEDHQLDYLEKLLEEYGLEKPVERKVRLACDELLNNVISYAYEGASEHEIRIKMTMAQDRLTITISDDGKPFDPFTQPTPDTGSPLEERAIGGLGVHLVRNVMNKIAYHREEGRAAKNVITLVKYLNQQERGEEPASD